MVYRYNSADLAVRWRSKPTCCNHGQVGTSMDCQTCKEANGATMKCPCKSDVQYVDMKNHITNSV